MLGAGSHSGLHCKISGKWLREMPLGDNAELKVLQMRLISDFDDYEKYLRRTASKFITCPVFLENLMELHYFTHTRYCGREVLSLEEKDNKYSSCEKLEKPERNQAVCDTAHLSIKISNLDTCHSK